jgi:hypothetical protein
MGSKSNSSTRSSAGDTPRALTERVQARLSEVDASLELRRRARRPGGKRKKTEAAGGEPSAHREARAIATVFHELGDTHRQHRLHSGQRVSPELKQAAQAFKASPSLTTLVGVAAFLDGDGLLEW